MHAASRKPSVQVQVGFQGHLVSLPLQDSSGLSVLFDEDRVPCERRKLGSDGKRMSERLCRRTRGCCQSDGPGLRHPRAAAVFLPKYVSRLAEAGPPGARGGRRGSAQGLCPRCRQLPEPPGRDRVALGQWLASLNLGLPACAERGCPRPTRTQGDEAGLSLGTSLWRWGLLPLLRAGLHGTPG